MIKLPVVDESIKNKRVLVRGDIDVPLKDGQIVDDTRLKDIKPTLDFLLENKCQVILCGHIGRPASADATARQALSTKPIQQYFPNIKVLENLRFDPREEANDEKLSKELADLADVFVNESFAESYRLVASLSVARFLPHFAGFRLAKEVEILSKVMENPKRPLVVIIGGIKWETKEPAVVKMRSIAQTVITSKDFPAGLDVKTEEIDKYQEVIARAATIVWNGPFGKIEDVTYQAGTRRLAELIASNKTAFKLVGGGDTVGFLDKLGLTEKFNWVCSGGGAMLHFLAGETLPGIELLMSS